MANDPTFTDTAMTIFRDTTSNPAARQPNCVIRSREGVTMSERVRS